MDIVSKTRNPRKEETNMATDLAKISDAQAVADKLAELPKDALLYIAGYVEGVRDRASKKPKDVKTA